MMKLVKLLKRKAFYVIGLTLVVGVAGVVVYGVWAGNRSGQHEILSPPGAIMVENSLISWDHVDNATGYIVSVDQEENEIQGAVFELSGLVESKSYHLRVRALGDNVRYLDSDWSSLVTVTRLPAPVLMLTNQKLGWNQIEGNQGYELYCDGKYLAHLARDATEYDLLKIEPGCKFQIQAKGDTRHMLDSPLSQAVGATKLNAPSNLRVDEMQLKWGAVEGAEGYLIEGEVPLMETPNTSYDLHGITPGVYSVTVQALSNRDGIYPSDKSVIEIAIAKKTLGDLSGVEVKQGRLVWTRLENASGYKILIKQNQILRKEIIEGPEEEFADLLALGLEPGTYAIEIYALGNDIYRDSEKVVVDYVKAGQKLPKADLGAIQNAVLHQGVLSWDALPNASGYVVNMTRDDVKIFNTNIGGDDPLELDIPGLNLENGTYTILLYALGDEQYNNSAVVSIAYTIIQLGAPQALTATDTQLSWKEVSGADGYVVVMGTQAPVEVPKNTYRWEGALTPGAYTFSVQAVSKNREVQNSAPAVIRYTQPKRTLGNVANCRIEYGVFKWAALEHATGYVVAIKTHDKTSVLQSFEKAPTNGLEVDLYALDLPLGNYCVTIYALGDATYDDSGEVSVNYQEKMIRDAEVRANFNYGNQYQDVNDYWVQHYLNFSLKKGMTFDTLNVPQSEWNTVYTAFLAGDDAAKSQAAAVIGNDIIITYYYKDEAGNNRVLLTNGAAPFVKNKLWGGWLWRYNGNAFAPLQGDIASPFSIGGMVPAATKLQVSANIGYRNPAGSNVAVSSTQLADIKGRVLYVDVDLIIREEGNVHFYKETLALEIAN